LRPGEYLERERERKREEEEERVSEGFG